MRSDGNSPKSYSCLGSSMSGPASALALSQRPHATQRAVSVDAESAVRRRGPRAPAPPRRARTRRPARTRRSPKCVITSTLRNLHTALVEGSLRRVTGGAGCGARPLTACALRGRTYDRRPTRESILVGRKYGDFLREYSGSIFKRNALIELLKEAGSSVIPCFGFLSQRRRHKGTAMVSAAPDAARPVGDELEFDPKLGLHQSLFLKNFFSHLPTIGT
ncbi:hypothetical protein EVAR_59601_1 [Eumeta japonica]|uniref:Uncharacterized protein n=1 Tax=Eumeta variegata TaxID=151549 RepID=A0A4C1Z5P6_EUMVA|nr:hypothetical protein EVAR_59601_1 [Eumeta japonica]